MRSTRFDTLPRLLDIFAARHRRRSRCASNGWRRSFPSATAWARSFSWWGKRRSCPPPCRSKPSPSRSRLITTHSECQPGRPAPHGEGQAGSLSVGSDVANFQSTKSAGCRFWSTPTTSRSPAPERMSSTDWSREAVVLDRFDRHVDPVVGDVGVVGGDQFSDHLDHLFDVVRGMRCVRRPLRSRRHPSPPTRRPRTWW